MSNNSMLNNFLSAMKLIADNAVSEAKADETLVMTVKSLNADGKASVEYQDVTYSDVMINGVSCEVGSRVYVLCPGGASGEGGKIILAPYTSGVIEGLPLAKEDTWVKQYESLIGTGTKGESGAINYTSIEHLSLFLTNFEYLRLSANFKTEFPASFYEKDISSVNFGIVLKLANSSIAKEFKLDLNNIVGFPFQLSGEEEQSIVVKIPEGTTGIESIEWFITNGTGVEPTTFEISNIQLVPVVESAKAQNSCRIMSLGDNKFFLLTTTKNDWVESIYRWRRRAKHTDSEVWQVFGTATQELTIGDTEIPWTVTEVEGMVELEDGLLLGTDMIELSTDVKKYSVSIADELLSSDIEYKLTATATHLDNKLTDVDYRWITMDLSSGIAVEEQQGQSIKINTTLIQGTDRYICQAFQNGIYLAEQHIEYKQDTRIVSLNLNTSTDLVAWSSQLEGPIKSAGLTAYSAVTANVTRNTTLLPLKEKLEIQAPDANWKLNTHYKLQYSGANSTEDTQVQLRIINFPDLDPSSDGFTFTFLYKDPNNVGSTDALKEDFTVKFYPAEADYNLNVSPTQINKSLVANGSISIQIVKTHALLKNPALLTPETLTEEGLTLKVTGGKLITKENSSTWSINWDQTTSDINIDLVKTDDENVVWQSQTVTFVQNGKGFANIARKYLATATYSTPAAPTATTWKNWKTKVEDTGFGKDKQYLWSAEYIYYSDKTDNYTNAEFVTQWVEDGLPGADGYSYAESKYFYQVNNSAGQAPNVDIVTTDNDLDIDSEEESDDIAISANGEPNAVDNSSWKESHAELVAGQALWVVEFQKYSRKNAKGTEEAYWKQLPTRLMTYVGADGVNEQGISLTATSQYFKILQNKEVTPESITIEVNNYGGIQGELTWYQDGTELEFTDGKIIAEDRGSTLLEFINDGDLKVYPAALGKKDLTTFTARLKETETEKEYKDEYTIAKLTDGANGYTVLLSNQHAAFSADENGFVAAGTETSTYVRVWKGATELTDVNITRVDNPFDKESAVIETSYADSLAVVTIKVQKDFNFNHNDSTSGTILIQIRADDDKFSTTVGWTWTKTNTGATGAAAQQLVLDNDYDVITVTGKSDLGWNTLGQLPTCTAIAYDGDKQVSSAAINVTCSLKDEDNEPLIGYSFNENRLAITSISNEILAGTTGYFTFAWAGTEITAKFSFLIQQSDRDYNLVIPQTTVNKSNLGEDEERTISFTVKKWLGTGEPEILDTPGDDAEITIYAITNAEFPSSLTNKYKLSTWQVPYDKDTNFIRIRVVKEDNLTFVWDEETIEFVEDGLPGADAINIAVQNANLTFNTSQAGQSFTSTVVATVGGTNMSYGVGSTTSGWTFRVLLDESPLPSAIITTENKIADGSQTYQVEIYYNGQLIQDLIQDITIYWGVTPDSYTLTVTPDSWNTSINTSITPTVTITKNNTITFPYPATSVEAGQFTKFDSYDSDQQTSTGTLYRYRWSGIKSPLTNLTIGQCVKYEGYYYPIVAIGQSMYAYERLHEAIEVKTGDVLWTGTSITEQTTFDLYVNGVKVQSKTVSPMKDGDTGPQGPQGPQGEKGETGAQGPQGETGDQGTSITQTTVTRSPQDYSCLMNSLEEPPTFKVSSTSAPSTSAKEKTWYKGLLSQSNYPNSILWKVTRTTITTKISYSDNTTASTSAYEVTEPVRYGELGESVDNFNTLTNDGQFEGHFYGIQVGCKSGEGEAQVSYRTPAPMTISNLPIIAINKIGGMTYKTQNLIQYPYYHTTRTENGVTFTVNEDGSVIAKGTATADTSFHIRYATSHVLKLTKGKTYTLSGCPTGGSSSSYYLKIEDDTWTQGAGDYGASKTFTAQYEDYYVRIIVKDGYEINKAFYPMLNEGSEAMPFRPYYEGLRAAAVTEVVSHGANLLTFSTGTSTGAGVTYTKQSDGGIKATGTPTGASSTLLVEKTALPVGISTLWATPFGEFTNLAIRVQLLDASGRQLLLKDYTNQQSIDIKANYLTATHYSVWICRKTTGVECSGTIYPMISFEKPTEFEPYKEPVTLSIPTEVQELEGYGRGCGAHGNNHISWNEEGKVYWNVAIKRKIFNGTETFTLSSNKNGAVECALKLTGENIGYQDSNTLNCISNHYEAVTREYIYKNDGNYIAVAFDYLRIQDSEVTTVAEMQAKLKAWYDAGNPLIVDYIVKTPEVIDISDLITKDNLLIKVEPNGFITFENESKYAVPNEIASTAFQEVIPGSESQYSYVGQIELEASELLAQLVNVSLNEETALVVKDTISGTPVSFNRANVDYYVNASMIKTGILDANLIGAKAIKAEKIDVGSLEAQGLTAKKIEVKSGNNILFKADGGTGTNGIVEIAGFDVNAESLKQKNGNFKISADGNVTGAKITGSSFQSTNGKFSITEEGELTAKSGTFGGYKIDGENGFSTDFVQFSSSDETTEAYDGSDQKIVMKAGVQPSKVSSVTAETVTFSQHNILEQTSNPDFNLWYDLSKLSCITSSIEVTTIQTAATVAALPSLQPSTTLTIKPFLNNGIMFNGTVGTALSDGTIPITGGLSPSQELLFKITLYYSFGSGTAFGTKSVVISSKQTSDSTITILHPRNGESVEDISYATLKYFKIGIELLTPIKLISMLPEKDTWLRINLLPLLNSMFLSIGWQAYGILSTIQAGSSYLGWNFNLSASYVAKNSSLMPCILADNSIQSTHGSFRLGIKLGEDTEATDNGIVFTGDSGNKLSITWQELYNLIHPET